MTVQPRIGRRERRDRTVASICALALSALLVALPRVAPAVPSFATQTGLPCAQCHVTAFGPALTQYGRQFKLNGYVWKKPGGLNIPLAATLVSGYSDTSRSLPGPAAPGYSSNNNFALLNVNLYLAGGFGDHVGGLVKGTYDRILNAKVWNDLDLRSAHALELGGHALILGVDVNNNPTVQDLWNSTPAWGFPYVTSELLPGPIAAPQLRGGLADTTLGASVYSMIDNLVYVELGAYRELSGKWLANLGLPGASTHVTGGAPYARVALQRQQGANYFEVGMVALNEKRQPLRTSADTDRYSDYGLDASYQLTDGGAHALDAHLSWIHESRHLDASFAALGSDAVANSLDSILADVTYAVRQTWLASAGVFATNGSANRLLFAPAPVGGSAAHSPNSRGYVLQLEIIPFGKLQSFASPWNNVRAGLQYTGYLRFNGGNANYDGFGRSASDNNALFAFLWLAF